MSAAAPDLHFDDCEPLESALAVEGFDHVWVTMEALPSPPADAAALSECGVAYVRFALAHPGRFKLMLGRECDDRDDDRGRAASALNADFFDAVAAVFPGPGTEALATAGWATAHGLAFLHLDGKPDNLAPEAIDERVRASFMAVFDPIRSRP
ncbi:TetR-like C-terminal domain-containing protein [Corynebacterium freneyi]|uniref:TetR-like C-terminal domain-containing protein n=1 Tax=Corynebacterium freneyi TaxID=134034 RepID=UPI00396C71A0